MRTVPTHSLDLVDLVLIGLNLEGGRKMQPLPLYLTLGTIYYDL